MKLYTWGYHREIEEGKFEARTIFAIADSEEEAKMAVKKKYAKSGDAMHYNTQ